MGPYLRLTSPPQDDRVFGDAMLPIMAKSLTYLIVGSSPHCAQLINELLEIIKQGAQDLKVIDALRR